MNFTNKSDLKIKAHSLKPVVIIGQLGLTKSVLTEIKLALMAHELIKIKIRAERHVRKTINQQICVDTQAELIQTLGQISIIYRYNPDK